jgi:hypothetical protein
VKKSLRLACILALLCSAFAQAATITAVGVPVIAAQPALVIVNALPDYPADWKIYVAGEKQWAGLMSKVDHTSQAAVTDRKQRTTIVRGLIFTDLPATGIHVTAQHVLAHELGHIMCNCDDEWTAESYARAHSK